ncbi:enoyl-CoA hydratase/isomerase family protein [soil metagenome]
MTDTELLVEVAGPVATVTINRPAKRNALTLGMWRELAAICRELQAERALRALVLTGAGPSFCAGADISSLSEDDASLKAAVFDAEEALRTLDVPSVAKIRGFCMGGGNQLAVACDLRIVDTTSVFAVPPAKLSVVYPANSIRSLVALVGPSATKRLLFTAGSIDAAEALRIGLVDEVVQPDLLDDHVAALVSSMLPLAPMTQVAGKQLVNAIVAGADAEALYQQWYAEWTTNSDGREGPQAFLKKRPPEFTWRRSS